MWCRKYPKQQEKACHGDKLRKQNMNNISVVVVIAVGHVYSR